MYRVPGVAYDDDDNTDDSREPGKGIVRPDLPPNYLSIDQRIALHDAGEATAAEQVAVEASYEYDDLLEAAEKAEARAAKRAGERAAMDEMRRRDAAAREQSMPQAHDTPGPVPPAEMDTHRRMVAQIWAMSLADDPGPGSGPALIEELVVGFGLRPDSAVDIAMDFAKLHGHAWSREVLAAIANQIAMAIAANKTKTGSRVQGAIADVRAALTGHGTDGRPRTDRATATPDHPAPYGATAAHVDIVQRNEDRSNNRQECSFSRARVRYCRVGTPTQETASPCNSSKEELHAVFAKSAL